MREEWARGPAPLVAHLDAETRRALAARVEPGCGPTEAARGVRGVRRKLLAGGRDPCRMRPMLLRSLLTCGALLLLLPACEPQQPANDAQAAEAARAKARSKLFRGCTAKMVGKNVALTCGQLIVTVYRVNTPISDEAAAENQDNFEKEFPPEMRRVRSRPNVDGKTCWASAIDGPEGGWGKLLIIPTGPSEGLVLSCGDRTRDTMPRCEQMFQELAQGYTPPIVAAAFKSYKKK